VRAELHADGGAGTASDEFFRSAEFLAAEGTTHTLEIGPLLLPLIVREVPGEDALTDAISPYGYPGATVAPGAEPVDPADVDWSATGLVSVFVRDRIGEPHAFRGATPRSQVQVHDPSRARAVRSRLTEQIRRNERAGWSVAVSAGPEASPADRARFLGLYTETMRRTRAAERYFFDERYFAAILAQPYTWLLHASSGGAEAGAGAIVVRSDGLLHYFLGGTADAALDASPFKNVVAAMLDLADGAALPLSLGGGVEPGDGLEAFKRGFANEELPFVTHGLVCDPAAYERLAAGRDAGGFFPAYRAP
jgi:Acetyltransferase (GNAT) domain